jgi:Uma2 family endonuclease
MSAVMNPPPALRVKVPPLRWTVKEFHDLGEAGYFENRRAFLIDGIIYEQGFMNEPHVIALILCQEVFQGIFGRGWVIRNQVPLVLGQHTDPRPDFAIVRGTARGQRPHPTTAELVVEVSDTTLDYDLTEKAELYAVAGIPEYWVLDLNARVLHVLRDPGTVAANGTAYRSQQQLGPDDTVAPLAAPDRAVKVSDLLP